MSEGSSSVVARSARGFESLESSEQPMIIAPARAIGKSRAFFCITTLGF